MKPYSVGIDEVGRGPLAGPVMVGVVVLPKDFNWQLLPGVTDSKKLTPQKRTVIFNAALKLKLQGCLDYEVGAVSAQQIDRFGIVEAIKKALKRSLEKLRQRQKFSPHEVEIKLDGGLRAPVCYLHQETIIKGDLHEPVIGIASIVAKVTRDLYMERLAQKTAYKGYDFAKHKGYGTVVHRQAIQTLGLSDEHRQTFCRNITVSG